jgi:hypothetical protein
VRYLTKSRFSLALECPTKLDYVDDANFANADQDNEFLMALADGGHQVGALAKCLFADGIEIDVRGHDAQVELTTELLRQDSVTLYEAAIRVGRLFVRADILRKQGDTLELYEVKAKGYDSSQSDTQFIGAKGGFLSPMKPYLYDVAFQRHVMRLAFPGMKLRTHLVMPDKSQTCTEERLAQRLAIRRAGRRVQIDIDPSLRDGTAARQVLAVVPVDAYLDQLEKEPLEMGGWTYAFAEGITELADRLDRDPFAPRPGSHCKSCQFRAAPEDASEGLRDGRHHCWSRALHVDAAASPTIFDLYSHRKTEALLEKGSVLLRDLEPEDVGLDADDEDQITLRHRQWLQCEEARGEITRPFVRTHALRELIDGVKYPLHFIDFETSRPSLPFHAGRRPYEQLLFQFSHHQLDADGTLCHAHQYLCTEVGRPPSVETLRALMAAIGNDDGTVMHWWDHERTVLGEIAKQLTATSPEDLPDRDQLLAFISSLRGGKDGGGRMLDLGRSVHRLMFLPGTRGSSSLKRVLPALLALSQRLRDRYAQPIYGAANGIPSLNFANQAWLQTRPDGSVRDPYELLGERVDDPDLAGLESLEDEGSTIADGGAAMVAYGVLQNELLDETRRQRVRQQLLRYCELDTLAMEFAWEALLELSRTT